MTAGAPASRAIVYCYCSSGATVKRGRWYTYDGLGRATATSLALQTGSTIGTPASIAMSWTAGSRITSVGSPLVSTFGTTYGYSPNDGSLTTIQTGSPLASVATSITHRPFGPTAGYVANSFVSGLYQYKLNPAMTYRTDYSLSKVRWWAPEVNNSQAPLKYLEQTLTYSPAGLLATRTDAALSTNSRTYTYDSMMRLTCETRSLSTADCVVGNANLASLVTYHDGASDTQPPDNRSVAVLRAYGYVNSNADTYSYAGGSSKPVQVTRAANSQLVLGYDPLGRRTFDFDSYDPIRSRRDYTYLPNGLLGTISGKTGASVNWSVSVQYDNAARPVYISRTGALAGTYELYYDDASRLIAVNNINGTKTIRWHYHYLDGQPIAATREVVVGTTTTVSRFWFIFDERGLIHRALDQNGVEQFRAHYDASGWRTIDLATTDVWVLPR